MLKRRRPKDVDAQIRLLQDLVVNEIVEFVVPLTYLICLLAGYFGPNSELLGNIGNGDWQYSPIEDINHTVRYVLMFFLVDLGSLLVSATLLWWLCRANLYEAFTLIQKEFGLAFTIQMAMNLSCVRKIFYKLLIYKLNIFGIRRYLKSLIIMINLFLFLVFCGKLDIIRN